MPKVHKTPGSSTNVWVVRAGSQGEAEASNLELGRASIAWGEVNDLSTATSREQVREIVDGLYPDSTPQSRANTAGQIWAFRSSIAVGDLVVMPLKTQPGMIALGRCVGPYGYDPEAPEVARHYLPVQWQRELISRDVLQPDLLAMVNGAMTTFSVYRNNAAERLQWVAEHGTDPGLGGADGVQEPVRRGLLFHTLLEVLDEHGGPLRSLDAYDRVEERLAGQLTDYELAAFRDTDDKPRWRHNLGWGITDMVAAGWMTKGRNGWTITDAGREALASHPGGLGLDEDAHQAYLAQLYARRRAWLVRGSSVDGHDLVPRWRQEGFVSLRAAKLREVEPGIARDELKGVVNEDYSQTSYASKAAKLDEFHAFLSRMKLDDVVATTSQGRLYVGTIAGEAEYVRSADGLSNLRRAVEWSPVDVDYSDLANELKARLQVQYDVVELTQQLDLLEAMLVPVVVKRGDQVRPPLELPDATDELATDLNVDRNWVQECVELLRDRPQLIFYGPPGTGKTYIAQALATHLAGDNVRLVQFHPAYSYEDFFEGYRPLEEGGFKLKPGPLRKVVDAARDNPSTPYVLIIDELNRGNLAKIFGELYFLLEYRSQNVDLLYATDDDIGFTLPENVFIIGTMNTADRSIALVDAAMRRRFAFVPLHPSEPPTSGVLRRWLAASELDAGIADLHDELNARIEDDDFKIGPSYFMRKAVHEPGGLERAWRTAILPLLEEHHYGDGIDVRSRYGLDAIRARVASRRSVETEVDGGEPADPA